MSSCITFRKWAISGRSYLFLQSKATREASDSRPNSLYKSNSAECSVSKITDSSCVISFKCVEFLRGNQINPTDKLFWLPNVLFKVMYWDAQGIGIPEWEDRGLAVDLDLTCHVIPSDYHCLFWKSCQQYSLTLVYATNLQESSEKLALIESYLPYIFSFFMFSTKQQAYVRPSQPSYLWNNNEGVKKV
jgi:hypothetical protein